jgi:hypothetical protein
MKPYLLLLLFVLNIAGALQAQQLDWCKPAERPPGVGEGGFKVKDDVYIGCSPFKVTVEKTVGESPLYIYDYKSGDPTKSPYSPVPSTENTYVKQGSFRILQLISNGSGAVFCREVEVFEKPNFTVKTCSALRVIVTIPADSVNNRYEAFSIDWGDGSPFQRVTKTANTTLDHTYTNANPKQITVSGVYVGSDQLRAAGSPECYFEQ